MILHKKTVNNNNAAAISGVSSMRVFAARISQSGTANPTVVQIANTLGVSLASATYLGVGTYRLTFGIGAFLLGKTICLTSPSTSPLVPGFTFLSNTATNLNITTYNLAGALSDDVLANTNIYVEVYPS